ncbi:MAG: hypothetical protein A2Z16_16795 [Chloroflexi bacterium RBG_16_54_18]|nr:MAG: hypothetical protein A2Z16_16795 [Chloroflexi bacterium RBG_16_54_18]
MPIPTGQVFNNRYRIVKKLRQGGMGAVYQAWDLNLKKPVALKENLEIGVEAREQFDREANILANLSHPNLPRVTDHFSIEKQGQYLVMDFIEGEDLENMVDRLGPIPEDTAVGWFLQISSALDYLHRQPAPIIHRDIKPANIKISPDGRAILVDFGIAKFFGHDLVTMDGAKAVSPGFSPLEQYHASTDTRSDIYSLGSTLYTVVTGELIPESTRRALGEVKLIPPRQLQPDLSLALEAIILRAVEIQPERRYQSAAEFLTALKATFQKPAAPPQDDYLPQPVPVEGPQAAGFPVPSGVNNKSVLPGQNRSCFSIPVVILGIVGICAFTAIAVVLLNNRSRALVYSPTNPISQKTAVPTFNASIQTFLPIFPTSTQSTSNPTLISVPFSSIPTEILPGTPVSALLTLDRDYNCRGGTSRDYDIIRTLEQDTQLAIIGKSENGWWLVRLNDPNTNRQQCWIYGGIAAGNLSTVPYSDWTGTVETAKTPWPF